MTEAGILDVAGHLVQYKQASTDDEDDWCAGLDQRLVQVERDENGNDEENMHDVE